MVVRFLVLYNFFFFFGMWDVPGWHFISLFCLLQQSKWTDILCIGFPTTCQYILSVMYSPLILPLTRVLVILCSVCECLAEQQCLRHIVPLVKVSLHISCWSQMYSVKCASENLFLMVDTYPFEMKSNERTMTTSVNLACYYPYHNTIILWLPPHRTIHRKYWSLSSSFWRCCYLRLALTPTKCSVPVSVSHLCVVVSDEDLLWKSLVICWMSSHLCWRTTEGK